MTRPEAKQHSKFSARIRRFLISSGAAGLLMVGAALVVDYGTSVVVRDAEGGVVSRSPLPDSGNFEIEYMHSYYRAPASEHFVAGENEDFEFAGVSSPSEAVLDYYELEGRKEAEGDFLRLMPDEPQRFTTLPLIGTEKGRRTLVVSGERFPLYEEGGSNHVTIRIEEDNLFTELRRLLAG